MDCQQCGKCCEYNGVHFSQSHLDHLINKYNLDRDTIISELSQYGTFYKAWNACPFFTEDKKCLIHEDSPIECMMFLFIDFNNQLMIETACPAYSTVTFDDIEGYRLIILSPLMILKDTDLYSNVIVPTCVGENRTNEDS